MNYTFFYSLSYFPLFAFQGLLKQIDSGPTGIVYGVNKHDGIFCRTGITDDNLKGTGWRGVGGLLKYVSCGPYGCWGVNSADHIWVRSGVTAAKCEGTEWTRIPGLLSQIEVIARFVVVFWCSLPVKNNEFLNK